MIDFSLFMGKFYEGQKISKEIIVYPLNFILNFFMEKIWEQMTTNDIFITSLVEIWLYSLILRHWNWKILWNDFWGRWMTKWEKHIKPHIISYYLPYYTSFLIAYLHYVLMRCISWKQRYCKFEIHLIVSLRYFSFSN